MRPRRDPRGSSHQRPRGLGPPKAGVHPRGSGGPSSEVTAPADSWFIRPACTVLAVFSFIFGFVGFSGHGLQNQNDVRTAISLLALAISPADCVGFLLQWFTAPFRPCRDHSVASHRLLQTNPSAAESGPPHTRPGRPARAAHRCSRYENQ